MKKFTLLLVFALTANVFLTSDLFGQISLVSSGSATQTTDGAAVAVTNPGSLVVGHVMIANVIQNDNDNGEALSNPTAPAGWTLIDGRSLGSSGANDWWGAVFYKVVTAADVAAASFTFTPDPDADAISAGILVYRNVLASNIFDVAPGTINITNSDDLSASSITTVTNGAAIVMLGMNGNDETYSGWNTTSPGTLTEAIEEVTNNGADHSIGAAWAIMPTAGATGTGVSELSGTDNNFNGAILIALRPVNPTVTTANLWSVSGTGALRKYTMDPVTGTLLNGPETVVTPLTSTAAVAKNQITPNDAEGCIYYLNRDDGGTLNGVVTVYSLRPDGTGHGSRGTIDMNGADNGDFSFVRLGFDNQGRGWILAGADGSGNIYIASFQGNGVNAISGITTFGTLTVAAPGTTAEFQNGDLAISANGTLYALANVTDGQTYIYTLNSLNTPTTLTRKWIVQDNGGTFSGSVNGLAWTQSGSLHFSTSTGIYFIDQATANTGSGTVQASYVANTDGLSLTDLGSDKFPEQSTLPVTLGAFSVTKQGDFAVLNWKTTTEINTDHFEIERSYDGVSFTKVAAKAAAGNSNSDINYQHSDPINYNYQIVYYRLKTVDIDAKSSYSKIVALRLSNGPIRDLTVFPNPFTTDLKLQINSLTETTGTVRISNAIGQVVYNRNIILQKGENIVVLTSGLETLKPGMHLMEVITTQGKVTQKIIKR